MANETYQLCPHAASDSCPFYKYWKSETKNEKTGPDVLWQHGNRYSCLCLDEHDDTEPGNTFKFPKGLTKQLRVEEIGCAWVTLLTNSMIL